MIRQYLSNTNEISTIYILQNILELNEALASSTTLVGRPRERDLESS
jgi:hypothetical protein